MKKISIAMRSRNDAEFVRRTLDAIFSQSRGNFELLSFDNASSDGTAEILQEYAAVQKFHIPDGEYVPGRVLNYAVSKCSGDIVVFNNADAVPADARWLENITAKIERGEAGACYARQTCRPDALDWVASDYSRAFGDIPMSAEFFSMASSAADIRILRENPFDESIKYSEDVLWAKGLREKGVRVEYAPDAVVEHSHNYSTEAVKRRFAGEGRADAQIFGTPQGILKCAKGIAGAVARDLVFLARRGRLAKLPECVRARVAQKTSYYRARREAAGKLP